MPLTTESHMNDGRICFLMRNYLNSIPEGITIASLNIFNAVSCLLKDRVSVITLEEDTDLEGRKDAGPNPYTVFPIKAPTRNLSSALHWITETMKIGYVIKAIKKLDPRIIHILNVTKETYIPMLRIFKRKKTLSLCHLYHSYHAFEDKHFYRYRFFKLRSLILRLKPFDHILSTNRVLARYLVNKLSLDKEYVHYIPFPINTDYFHPVTKKHKNELRAKYRLPADKYIIGFVGSVVEPLRGFHILISALRHVLHYVSDVLLLVASIDPLTEDFRGVMKWKTPIEAINAYQLSSHIVRLGYVPSINEVYQLSDAVVLPFTHPHHAMDPPLVILEAMSCGLPVITTTVTSACEIIDHGANGLIVKPNDEKALAKEIISVIEDRSLSKRLARNARSKILSNFSMEVVGRKIVKLYESIT